MGRHNPRSVSFPLCALAGFFSTLLGTDAPRPITFGDTERRKEESSRCYDATSGSSPLSFSFAGMTAKKTSGTLMTCGFGDTRLTGFGALPSNSLLLVSFHDVQRMCFAKRARKIGLLLHQRPWCNAKSERCDLGRFRCRSRRFPWRAVLGHARHFSRFGAMTCCE